MLYNEFYENTMECETSFYLGCKNCKHCKVKEYNEQVRKEMEEEEKAKQRFYERVYGDEVEYDWDYMDEDPEYFEAISEIEELKTALKEIKIADIVETAKSVVKKQIKEKNIEIYNFYGNYEESLEQCYRELFGLEISEMSFEELDKIEIGGE